MRSDTEDVAIAKEWKEGIYMVRVVEQNRSPRVLHTLYTTCDPICHTPLRHINLTILPLSSDIFVSALFPGELQWPTYHSDESEDKGAEDPIVHQLQTPCPCYR